MIMISCEMKVCVLFFARKECPYGAECGTKINVYLQQMYYYEFLYNM